MLPPQLSLSPDLFAKAFPFHFVFNRNCEIVQVGNVLERISSATLVGEHISLHFLINRPNSRLDFDAISKNSRSLFLLEFILNGMYLKGQMMYEQEQDVIFFLGSPWITDTASLAPLGIKLKDFAIHDPVVDFLFLLQAQKAALADTHKLTTVLTQQREELQTTLQIKESLAEIAKKQSRKLQNSLKELKQTQSQLIQAEKMSSLGLLVAGVAHEINNPVNFISGNLTHAEEYIQELINILHLYQQFYPNPVPNIQKYIEEVDLDFLLSDFTNILNSMKAGTQRIAAIVLSLRNFSRLDEADMKMVDIHEGIDSTLLILQSRLKNKVNHPEIEIVKNYGNLPLVECFAGQLNQVFMNIISNAIDSLISHDNQRSITEIKKNPSKIIITTKLLETNSISIQIADNGLGMTDEVKKRLFDPFFTTKPVGQGTGLGLSISYQIIVDKHKGELKYSSKLGQGAEFWIEIPTLLNKQLVNHVESLSRVK